MTLKKMTAAAGPPPPRPRHHDVISGAVEIQFTQLPGFFFSTQLNKFLEIEVLGNAAGKGAHVDSACFPKRSA